MLEKLDLNIWRLHKGSWESTHWLGTPWKGPGNFPRTVESSSSAPVGASPQLWLWILQAPVTIRGSACVFPSLVTYWLCAEEAVSISLRLAGWKLQWKEEWEKGTDSRHSENNYAFIQTAPVSHALVLCFKNEKSLHMPLVFTLTQTGHSEELKSVSMLFSIFTKC